VENLTANNIAENNIQAEVILPPIAIVQGQPVTLLPQDLYIPPDALEVFLETFQGPLDLLLYLIKRQNLDILNIPIAEITRQYIAYVELMKTFQLELAAEYLVMAAMLAEIKSRLLLPRPIDANADEEDPRAELVRRLQEYEQIKRAAESLELLPQVNREIFITHAHVQTGPAVKPLPVVDMRELLSALSDVMSRVSHTAKHTIEQEPLSIRERMSEVLARIRADSYTEFTQLFNVSEGRMGVVVTFIAILELLKQLLIELVQHEPFSPIHIKAVAAHE
jgi:segregation and condensation protein A